MLDQSPKRTCEFSYFFSLIFCIFVICSTIQGIFFTFSFKPFNWIFHFQYRIQEEPFLVPNVPFLMAFCICFKDEISNLIFPTTSNINFFFNVFCSCFSQGHFFFVALVSIFHVTGWCDLQLSIYISISEGLSLEQVSYSREASTNHQWEWGKRRSKGEGLAGELVCPVKAPALSCVTSSGPEFPLFKTSPESRHHIFSLDLRRNFILLRVVKGSRESVSWSTLF